MSTASELAEIFADQLTNANDLLTETRDGLAQAFGSFTDKSAFAYVPYEWQTPSPPQIFYNPSFNTPSKPALPQAIVAPTIKEYPTAIVNPTFGEAPVFNVTAPVMSFPTGSPNEPSEGFGAIPSIYQPHFASAPTLLPLPSAALPYPTLALPTTPTLTDPVFDGVVPADLQNISLNEYLTKLTDTYAEYSASIPELVRSNWFVWFRTMLAENPLVDKLATTISDYIDNGGSGIPVPIEEAIVTRATDRVTSEQRRATVAVYEGVARRGLTLPSGALIAGLKGARQIAAEAVSKVATDVAIKNLELEHDHMKFMMQLGVELEKMVLGFAGDCAKTVVELNGQAIEVTKLVLTGMIEINNAIVKIYLARWEAYKAAVEVFRAKWQALEMKVRLYEAQIKAELAKTEINKATVDTLRALVNANEALIAMYKVTVEAEGAKIETSRVAIMGYEAAVRAYVAKVEAYRAKWEGFKAQTEAQTAKARVYESQANAYSATVNGYKAKIEGYAALVHAQASVIDATSKENEGRLKAWQIQTEGNTHAYTAAMDGYGKEWAAVGEQLRGYATGASIMGDFLSKMYTNELHIDTERAREHLSEWRSQLEATLQAAQGLVQASNVAGNVAASALNGLTAFSGVLSTESA